MEMLNLWERHENFPYTHIYVIVLAQEPKSDHGSVRILARPRFTVSTYGTKQPGPGENSKNTCSIHVRLDRLPGSIDLPTLRSSDLLSASERGNP
jgi:hypothetical protein